MWIDLLIIALLGLAGWLGWQRGLLLVLAELVNFGFSLTMATLLYRGAGGWLAAQFGVIPPLADVVAFGLISVTINILLWYGLRGLIKQLPQHWLQANLNRAGGGVANVFQTLVVVTIALIMLNGLPLRAEQKESLTSGQIAQTLLRYSSRWQQSINNLVGDNLQQTLNFLTVRNTSTESVQLGYTTTNVRVNEAAEWRMLDLINRERRSRGLVALTLNDPARAVARKHSADMFARGYFAHINPDGQDPFERMSAGGVKYTYAGENLALAPTVAAAHEGLMNSPGHRANILRPEFRTVGIGVIDGGPYGQMFTQNFTD